MENDQQPNSHNADSTELAGKETTNELLHPKEPESPEKAAHEADGKSGHDEAGLIELELAAQKLVEVCLEKPMAMQQEGQVGVTPTAASQCTEPDAAAPIETEVHDLPADFNATTFGQGNNPLPRYIDSNDRHSRS